MFRQYHPRVHCCMLYPPEDACRPDKLRFQRPYLHPFDTNFKQQHNAGTLTIYQQSFKAEGFASTGMPCELCQAEECQQPAAQDKSNNQCLAVWDSSILTSKYIEHVPSLVSGKRVCDVSAGTGLVGMIPPHLTLSFTPSAHLLLPKSIPLPPIGTIFHISTVVLFIPFDGISCLHRSTIACTGLPHGPAVIVLAGSVITVSERPTLILLLTKRCR